MKCKNMMVCSCCSLAIPISLFLYTFVLSNKTKKDMKVVEKDMVEDIKNMV